MGDLARAVLADLDEKALGRLAERLASHLPWRPSAGFAARKPGPCCFTTSAPRWASPGIRTPLLLPI